MSIYYEFLVIAGWAVACRPQCVCPLPVLTKIKSGGAGVTRFNMTWYCDSARVTELTPEATLTKDALYLARTGKLWGVCLEDSGEIWPRHKSVAQYMEFKRTEVLFPMHTYLPFAII